MENWSNRNKLEGKMNITVNNKVYRVVTIDELRQLLEFLTGKKVSFN